MSSPLLTICIPTYNRAAHLDALLSFLRPNFMDCPDYDLEVVVVNNASHDATASVLEKHKHSRLKTILVERHRSTAEENIMRSVEYCSGEYVWFLGDDDVPMIANFPAHYALLEQRKWDFCLFNPAIVDSSGRVAYLRNVVMNAPMLETGMPSLVVSVGCLFTLAGISNQIIRRRLLSIERGLHYMSISRIYSMMAWIIDVCRSASAVFVNAPLIYYRENDYGGHWSRVASQLNVGDFHFWSLGLADLLAELVGNGALTYAQVAKICEVTRDGARFVLLDEMINKACEQLIQGLQAKDSRQRYTSEQFDRLCHFFLSADAAYYDLVTILRRIYAANTYGHAVDVDRARFMTLLMHRKALNGANHRVQCVCYGFEIIKTEFAYVAVRQSKREMWEYVLRVMDPCTQAPDVFVDETMAGLLEKLKQSVVQQQGELYGGAVSAIAGYDEYAARLSAIYSSTSWRVTAPLRVAKGVLKRILRGA